MRVLAVVPYPPGRAPGQRYRIEQWAPYLRTAGIEICLSPFSGDDLADALYAPGRQVFKARKMIAAWVSSLASVWRAGEYDAAYIYREAALIGPAILERVARRRNARIVYDFDDAIWLPYVSPRNRHLSYLKAPGKTGTICRLAAAITVGNENLATYARRYNPAVTVVPSTVSLREYLPRRAAQAKGVPVIGWTGSHSSAQYLRLVEGALRTLARKRTFRLRVVGLTGYQIEGVAVECVPWRPQTEVEDLWEMDIGIMPLSDDPWARGKCAMKAIQYMGVGLPTVVSPVGVNRDVVDHGVHGLHAGSEDEWVRALDALLADDDLRTRMGAEGRKRVEVSYSAEVQAPRLGAIFRSLLK